MITKLNVVKDAQQIHKVMQAAYKVEADFLNITEFYPLNRSVEDIAGSKNTFLGFMKDKDLVGVCELEMVDEYTVMISALVVMPTLFRSGIASKLLEYVIDIHDTKAILVSTAKHNVPAVSLYQKFGFEIYTELNLSDGLEIVELVLG